MPWPLEPACGHNHIPSRLAPALYVACRHCHGPHIMPAAKMFSREKL
jgi:hypothetical protein